MNHHTNQTAHNQMINDMSLLREYLTNAAHKLEIVMDILQRKNPTGHRPDCDRCNYQRLYYQRQQDQVAKLMRHATKQQLNPRHRDTIVAKDTAKGVS